MLYIKKWWRWIRVLCTTVTKRFFSRKKSIWFQLWWGNSQKSFMKAWLMNGSRTMWPITCHQKHQKKGLQKLMRLRTRQLWQGQSVYIIDKIIEFVLRLVWMTFESTKCSMIYASKALLSNRIKKLPTKMITWFIQVSQVWPLSNLLGLLKENSQISVQIKPIICVFKNMRPPRGCSLLMTLW